MSLSPALKRSVEAASTEIRMLIGDAWRPASDSYEVREPYRNTVVARATRSSLSDLFDALDAAVAARAKAAATLLVQRAGLIGEVMAHHDGRTHGSFQLLAQSPQNRRFWR